MALFPGGGGEVVRERDSPEMGSPKRPRTPRVLATFWASYGPTPPTPIRPKNAQKRALRASSVPRKFRRQNARQLFFLGANIFHKNLPRQLFFLSFFFRVDTDSDSKAKKFSRRLRRRESYVNSQKNILVLPFSLRACAPRFRGAHCCARASHRCSRCATRPRRTARSGRSACARRGRRASARWRRPWPGASALACPGEDSCWRGWSCGLRTGAPAAPRALGGPHAVEHPPSSQIPWRALVLPKAKEKVNKKLRPDNFTRITEAGKISKWQI